MLFFRLTTLDQFPTKSQSAMQSLKRDYNVSLKQRSAFHLSGAF